MFGARMQEGAESWEAEEFAAMEADWEEEQMLLGEEADLLPEKSSNGVHLEHLKWE